jgi:NAD(P)-dependent dehydrogenase (short-subunit alcohol dehydrogenase family)
MEPVADINTNEWRYVFEINVTAQFIACHEMVPYMKAAGGGCIIIMSSVAARIGYKNRSPYGASKRAVLGLTAALARVVAVDGIRVNAILPGAVRGERFEQKMIRFAEQGGLRWKRPFQLISAGRQSAGWPSPKK